jgi:cytochrome c oxidase subunit III
MYEENDTGGVVSEANLTMSGPPEGIIEESPFSIPSRKLAIWLFIIGDAATFAAILVAYGFLRNGMPDWPRPFHSAVNVAIMTFILITSSLTMLLAVRAGKDGNRSAATQWIFITVACGILFAILHIREWIGLIGEGMTMSKNPWGTGVFGAAFFGVTGLHLMHVTAGVIALIVVGLRYRSGHLNTGHVETAGIYWHFVDLVWMFVVPFMYLLNLAH